MRTSVACRRSQQQHPNGCKGRPGGALFAFLRLRRRRFAACPAGSWSAASGVACMPGPWELWPPPPCPTWPVPATGDACGPLPEASVDSESIAKMPVASPAAGFAPASGTFAPASGGFLTAHSARSGTLDAHCCTHNSAASKAQQACSHWVDGIGTFRHVEMVPTVYVSVGVGAAGGGKTWGGAVGWFGSPSR
jgi:hypothetical protein